MIIEDFMLARIQSNLVMPEDFIGHDLLERACLYGVSFKTTADEDYSKLEYPKMLVLLEEFFKSQDPDFYAIYRNVLSSKSVTIYDANKINPNSLKYAGKKDENGFKIYDEAMLIRKNGKYRMILPIHENVSDLYTFVHEIAHMFDKNLDNNSGLNILSEVTAFAFEKKLGEFLITKGYNDDVSRFESSRGEYIYNRSNQLLHQIMLVNATENSSFLSFLSVKDYILGSSRITKQMGITEDNYKKYYRDNISGMKSVNVNDIIALGPYVIASYVVNKRNLAKDDKRLKVHASTLGKVDQYRSFEIIGEECYDELEEKSAGRFR